MLGNATSFSGFAVKDVPAAKAFYQDILDLSVTEDADMGLLTLHLSDGCEVMVYPKPDHQPATYTVLNFAVDDIDKAVTGLTERGVEFTRYKGFDADDMGIVRSAGGGPDIAWFTDPSGNIFAVMQPK